MKEAPANGAQSWFDEGDVILRGSTISQPPRHPVPLRPPPGTRWRGWGELAGAEGKGPLTHHSWLTPTRASMPELFTASLKESRSPLPLVKTIRALQRSSFGSEM